MIRKGIKVKINKIVQLNGTYIKGSISNNIVTFDSLHITNEDSSKKVKFSRSELDKLITELQAVRNELEGTSQSFNIYE